jgi:hypothetical protein
MGFYDGWGTVTRQLAELAEQRADPKANAERSPQQTEGNTR